MRVRLIVLLAAGCLACGAVTKADAIYTLAYVPYYQIHAPAWSFEVPAIITTDTTITDFLYADSGLLFAGCPSVSSVMISNPQTDGGVDTAIPGCMLDETIDFGVPITSFGTYAAGLATLTISPSVATAEPSSLLLLGTGIIPMFWVARRKLPRPMEYRWAH